jgi:glutaredoxin
MALKFLNWMRILTAISSLKSFQLRKTFPQIIINGDKIGGFSELEQWMAFNKPDDSF